MSFADPTQQQQQQQQQQLNNPYSGFNTFNLQAQMTGMPPTAVNGQQSNPFGANMFSVQSQPTGMFATPTQQQLQPQSVQTQVTYMARAFLSLIKF
jgi:transcription initiation factor TFIID subunit TAF12